jgi:hypothetical protein
VCQRNQKVLSELGLAYFRNRQIGRMLGAEFRHAGQGKIAPDLAAEAIAPRAEPFLTEHGTLLFSFENAIGGVDHLITVEEQGYHQAQKRLETLARVFNEPRVDLFLSIRNYSTFFNSAYSELVRLGYGLEAKEAKDRIFATSFSWVEFVERILTAWPCANLTIWDHADYKANESKILDEFCGVGGVINWDYPEAEPRASISHNAARALVALRPYMQAQKFHDREQIAERLIGAFPDGPENPRLNLWSDAEATALTERYGSDLESLRNNKLVKVLSF